MTPSTSQFNTPPLFPGVSLARVASILRFATLLGNGSPTVRCLAPDAEGGGRTRFDSGGPDFTAAVFELFRVLEERRVRYLLVGGVALLRYVPGRNTDDIDLLLAVEDLGRVPEISVQERTDWFAKARFQEIRVDLLLTANPLFRRVHTLYASRQPFLERDIPCATPEGLLLLKLYALPSLYRQGEIQKANLYEADVAALLLAAQPPVEPLFQELSSHVSQTVLTELRKIVAEARARQRRFGD